MVKVLRWWNELGIGLGQEYENDRPGHVVLIPPPPGGMPLVCEYAGETRYGHGTGQNGILILNWEETRPNSEEPFVNNPMPWSTPGVTLNHREFMPQLPDRFEEVVGALLDCEMVASQGGDECHSVMTWSLLHGGNLLVEATFYDEIAPNENSVVGDRSLLSVLCWLEDCRLTMVEKWPAIDGFSAFDEESGEMTDPEEFHCSFGEVVEEMRQVFLAGKVQSQESAQFDSRVAHQSQKPTREGVEQLQDWQGFQKALKTANPDVPSTRWHNLSPLGEVVYLWAAAMVFPEKIQWADSKFEEPRAELRFMEHFMATATAVFIEFDRLRKTWNWQLDDETQEKAEELGFGRWELNFVFGEEQIPIWLEALAELR